MKFGELELFTTITNIVKKYHNGRPLTVIGNNLELVDFFKENGLEIKNLFSAIEEKTDEEDITDTENISGEENISDEESISGEEDNSNDEDSSGGEEQADSIEYAQEDAVNAEPSPVSSKPAKAPDPDSYILENEIDPYENYVVFTEAKRRKDLCEELEVLGFSEFKDYVFVNHGKIILHKGSPDYHDEYGNNIHCKVCTVYIQEYACNVNINVDNSAKFDEKCFISARHLGGAEITVGADCRFVDNVSLVAAGTGKITIGSGTKIVMNSGIVALEGHTIAIGENCLFSYDVKIYSGDGHAIYNTRTGKRMNPPVPTRRSVISIGDHVWVGMRAVILNRCSIGSGSIVGAGAIVKGTFPNNCVINGNPARITAKNVAWSEAV